MIANLDNGEALSLSQPEAWASIRSRFVDNSAHEDEVGFHLRPSTTSCVRFFVDDIISDARICHGLRVADIRSMQRKQLSSLFDPDSNQETLPFWAG